MIQPKVSHGRSARAVTLGDYRLTEARYAPNQTVGWHEHAFSSWTFVLSGSFDETFARDNHTCEAGSVLIKPATADHANVYGPSGAHCLIIETLRSEEAITDDEKELFVAPRRVAGGVIPHIAQSIQRELKVMDRLSTLALEGLLIELAVASSRYVRPGRRVSAKRWLNCVREQLESEFRSPPSLSALAASHRVHPVYLCQEFHAAFGMSVGNYVRLVRFEWARESLRSGGRPISDIALAAGFSDQAHFTRDFKARTGASPRRYRSAIASLRTSGHNQDSPGK